MSTGVTHLLPTVLPPDSPPAIVVTDEEGQDASSGSSHCHSTLQTDQDPYTHMVHQSECSDSQVSYGHATDIPTTQIFQEVDTEPIFQSALNGGEIHSTAFCVQETGDGAGEDNASDTVTRTHQWTAGADEETTSSSIATQTEALPASVHDTPPLTSHSLQEEVVAIGDQDVGEEYMSSTYAEELRQQAHRAGRGGEHRQDVIHGPELVEATQPHLAGFIHGPVLTSQSKPVVFKQPALRMCPYQGSLAQSSDVYRVPLQTSSATERPVGSISGRSVEQEPIYAKPHKADKYSVCDAGSVMGGATHTGTGLQGAHTSPEKVYILSNVSPNWNTLHGGHLSYRASGQSGSARGGSGWQRDSRSQSRWRAPQSGATSSLPHLSTRRATPPLIAVDTRQPAVLNNMVVREASRRDATASAAWARTCQIAGTASWPGRLWASHALATTAAAAFTFHAWTHPSDSFLLTTH